MVRGSFAWKCEGKVVRKSGLQRGLFLVRGSFYGDVREKLSEKVVFKQERPWSRVHSMET